jgi:DNA-binding MurR/RpiR family transcriptional regulator
MSASGFVSYPQGSFEEFVAALEKALPALPRQEAKLAQAMLLNLDMLALETGKSLAEKVGVPEVTVGRLLRRLGCDGMRELKRLLRQQYSVTGAFPDTRGDVLPALGSVLEAEIAAVTSVFQQTTSPAWHRAVELARGAAQVHVTGFQSVRGIAEDFARRLALARPGVAYLSPHDGMLGEWLDGDGAGACLIVVDVVPYAREATELARIARAQGRGIVVVSDEFCHWSREHADAAVYAPSRTGLYLESTLGLVAALSLLVDAVARAEADGAQERLTRWKSNSRRLGLF